VLYTLIAPSTKNKLKDLQKKYKASQSWIVEELIRNAAV